MVIPQQLQKDEFRFVLLKNKDKVPFEMNWTVKNYKFYEERLTSWIAEKNNYGIIGGYGGLIVLDFDNEEFQNKILPLLPKTFTVLSGSKKFHKYFICDNADSFKIFDKNKNTLLDVQGLGKQVVAPGSIHPNGNMYIVVDDSEITKISFKYLQIILADYMPEKLSYVSENSSDEIVNKIKKKLSLRKLLETYKYDLTKNPTMCKLGHESKEGKCFSYNLDKNVWFCFHCLEGGDIFNFIMAHDKCDFNVAKKKMISLAGIKNTIGMAIKSFQIDFIEFAYKFHEIQPFFYDKNRLFWLWNFALCCWERVDEIELFSMLEESAKEAGFKITTAACKWETETALKIVGRRNTPKPFPKNTIQFKDNLYNIYTGEISKATSEYFNTNPVLFNVGEFQETPVIDKIFEQWVGKEWKQTLYEIIAYCCLQEYPLHRIFCFFGGGSNGKTCFLNLLRKFLGNHNCSSSELEGLIDRFGTVSLYKKLACIMGETNFNMLEKTSLLKRISGNETIDFEFKGKDRFSDYSYAKLIIATNSMPQTSDKTEGFYRRWVIVDFPNTFSEKIDILGTIPEQEYENLALKCLYILKKLLSIREFTNEGDIAARKERFEKYSNPLRQFIKEKCEIGKNFEVPVFEFCEIFESWTKERTYRLMSKNEISRKMHEDGYITEQIKKRVNDDIVNWRYYIGLKLKEITKSNEKKMKTSEREKNKLLFGIDENFKNEINNLTP